MSESRNPWMEWRLFTSGCPSGAENMAIDEAMLWAHSRGLVPPTLRFYGWNPAAVSLGYFQSASDVDWDECAKLGYDIVRRPTGGRAILHDDEITYSLVLREEYLSGDRSVLGSYQWLSGGLVAGLRLMGIDASLETPGSGSSNRGAPEKASKTACFAKAARCDIVHGGKKVIGSAQVRRNGCILQHGSIPLSMNRQALQRVLRNSGDLAAAVALKEIDQTRHITFAEGIRQFIGGFSTALRIDLITEDLTEAELARSAALLERKHSQKGWVVDRETGCGIEE